MPDLPPGTLPPTSTPRPAGRTFCDAEGVEWRVSEEPFTDYDRRRGASIIFSSDNVVRRVRNYPRDWHELSDDALLALSWKV